MGELRREVTLSTHIFELSHSLSGLRTGNRAHWLVPLRSDNAHNIDTWRHGFVGIGLFRSYLNGENVTQDRRGDLPGVPTQTRRDCATVYFLV